MGDVTHPHIYIYLCYIYAHTHTLLLVLFGINLFSSKSGEMNPAE